MSSAYWLKKAMAARILKQDLFPLRWDFVLAVLYIASTYLLLGPHNSYSRQIVPIAPFAVLTVIQTYFVSRLCERDTMRDSITFFTNLPRDRVLTLKLRMLVMLGLTVFLEVLIAVGLWIYERSGLAPIPMFTPILFYVLPLFVLASLFWISHDFLFSPIPQLVGVVGTVSVMLRLYLLHDSRMDYDFAFFDFALCVFYLGAAAGILCITYCRWTRMQIGMMQ